MLPSRATPGSAGLDLHAVKEVIVKPNGREWVPLGLKMRIPDGYQGIVFGRSGLASRNGIVIGAGVIDQDFRGDVLVLMFNLGEEELKVTIGMRIAQLVLVPDNSVVSRWSVELDDTLRGEGGFGSTDVQNNAVNDSPEADVAAIKEMSHQEKNVAPEVTLEAGGALACAEGELSCLVDDLRPKSEVGDRRLRVVRDEGDGDQDVALQWQAKVVPKAKENSESLQRKVHEVLSSISTTRGATVPVSIVRFLDEWPLTRGAVNLMQAYGMPISRYSMVLQKQGVEWSGCLSSNFTISFRGQTNSDLTDFRGTCEDP